MMFEVADLMVASPATVSRCGMVYLEPSYIGLQAFVECWLKRLPDNIYVYKDIFKDLFNFFMEVNIIINSKICLSLSYILIFFDPIFIK